MKNATDVFEFGHTWSAYILRMYHFFILKRSLIQCVYAGVGWTKLEFKRLYTDNESQESANNGGNKN